ncbi:Hypothetical protein I595_2662 [Croceitalea dokdonensis DOKDO 023]|uniref:DUF4442 domain-containing protein n=2 Tax=Croceitalea TaxID=574891 RepID=A0A0P7ASK5_9FLAO|nr:Hypothetical protein I595_2662 [Croceitalea dokdonensis DOKDO 023]
MYRRTTGRIIYVSPDLSNIRVKLPLTYKNKNFVGTIFGGSLFASVDPIPMVQYMQLLGDDYVVWDKAAQIFFKRPGTQTLYAEFHVTPSDLESIKKRIVLEREIEFVQVTHLKDLGKTTTFCEVHKTIYIADKQFYKNKRRQKKST